jgi:hypothetical protein
MKRLSFLALSAFSLTVLAATMNAACSDPTELDNGMTEDQLRGSPYGGYGHGYGYGYYAAPATDVAADTSAQ